MKKHYGQKKLEISHASQILTNDCQILVLSLSYLITTVKFVMRLQQGHCENQSGNSLNLIIYRKIFSLQILAMISCVFVKL